MRKTLAQRLIETRSIDYVPLAERHGKVWHLWPVWFSGDAHLATVATGVVGIALGGNLALDGDCGDRWAVRWARSSWRFTRRRGRSWGCRR